MRMNVLLVGLLAGAGLSSGGGPPQYYSTVGKKCVATSGLTIVLGGAEVGTVTSSNFAEGAACTVIPPVGVATSITPRCYVDDSNTAHIVANTGIALGVSLDAATWCVEVRTVATAFVE